MDCPNCHVKLTGTQRQGVSIDYCAICRGIWLERGELDKIIQRTMSLAMPFPVPGEAEGDLSLSDSDLPVSNSDKSEPSKLYLTELFEVE
jgi:hypothetical protein